MKTTPIFRSSFLGLLGMIFSTVPWAHGGEAGTDTDQCKFELEKDHWLHYAAYQPKAFPFFHITHGEGQRVAYRTGLLKSQKPHQ